MWRAVFSTFEDTISTFEGVQSCEGNRNPGSPHNNSSYYFSLSL